MGPAETLRTNRITPMAPLAAPAMGALAAASAPARPAAADQAKLHRVAKQFEAMFMSEMIHQANPKPQSTGMFRAGIGETAMRPFMDQALGDAIAARGGTGLAKVIERSLAAAAAGKSK